MATQTFSRKEIASVVAVSVVAGSIPALQPLLLGALLAEGRVQAGPMGLAATLEGVGIVVATAAAGMWRAPRRLGWVAGAAILAGLVANILTITLPAPGIIVARGLSGLANGVLLWLFLSLLARSDLPSRIFGFYITGSATLVFLLSLMLGKYAIGRFGADSGYLFLIAVYVLLLTSLRFIPRSYVEIVNARTSNVPPPFGILGLLIVILYLTGVMAFWIYAVALGRQAGIATASMQAIIGAATGVQILAGLASIALATRLSGMQVVVFTAAGELVALSLTMAGGDVHLWTPALLLFAFCWLFSPPFHMAFAITADPSRRAAIFVGTAQLLGIAAGPLLASAVIDPPDYGHARVASMLCFGLVLAFTAVIWMKDASRSLWIADRQPDLDRVFGTEK